MDRPYPIIFTPGRVIDLCGRSQFGIKSHFMERAVNYSKRKRPADQRAAAPQVI